MSDGTTITERRCPKCGALLYMLNYSDWTLNGVRTVELVCERCLHTERVVTVDKGKDLLSTGQTLDT